MNPSSADGELDIGGIGRALARRKLWIAGTTLACLLGSVAFVTMVTPRYTAAANVLIENQENYFTRPATTAGSTDAQASLIDPEAVASQVQLVQSRDLGRRAIQELSLKGNVDFDPSAKPAGMLSGLLSIFSSGSKFNGSPDDRLLDTYFEALNVFPVVKTRVLQVEFSSRDPDLAARAANKVAELYIGVQSDAKRDSARASAASLGELIGDLRVKVAKAESEAEAFRANAGLTIGANNININGQQLSELNTQLGLAKVQQAEAQAKAKLLRDMVKAGRLGDVTEVSNNELIRRLSENRATLRGQIASESRTLLPGHPRIKELGAQLAELDGEIRLAVERTSRALENDAQIAGTRLENLRAAINQQKKDVGGSSADEAKARELDRVARQAKEQLESSVSKYQEAIAREASQSTPGDARIVSRAIAPQLPSFPKKGPIVIFATLAGLFVSMGVIVSSELMSGRAYAGAPGMPAQGEFGGDPGPGPGPRPRRRTPIGPRAPSLANLDNSPDFGGRGGRRGGASTAEAPISDAVTGLAARLSAAPASDYARRVLITSEAGEASASEVGAALGRCLARDARVILVEAGEDAPESDMRLGLGDLLAGTAGFEDAIHRDRGSRLHVMPVGGEPFDYGPECEGIFDALSRTYDFVLIAAPPLSRSDIALAITPDADCAVLACHGEPDAVALRELTHAGAGEVTAVSFSGVKSGRSAA